MESHSRWSIAWLWLGETTISPMFKPAGMAYDAHQEQNRHLFVPSVHHAVVRCPSKFASINSAFGSRLEIQMLADEMLLLWKKINQFQAGR